MKIAVNTRLLLKDKLEGIGWFEYETLKRITRQHQETEFIFIFDRKYDESFIFSDNITPIITKPQARHPFLYYLWFEYSVRRVLEKYKPDLFLSPDGYLSLSAKTKTLSVIHDLNFEHCPEHLPFLTRRYYRYYFSKFAEHATRLATVSEFSKNDIVNLYGIQESKIDVVYNGANEDYKPVNDETKRETLNKYTEGKPYFVFIGSLHPRKNLTGLFKAYDLFRKEKEGVKLIIIGTKRWWTDEIEKTYFNSQFINDIIFTGRLDEKQVNNVIGSAIALVLPSFFEGFGIPIVEAFYCGTPVITSNLNAMKEIAGDAALLTDPFTPESIKEAMMQLVENAGLRNQLIINGNIRREQFTWQKTSDKLWNSIELVINS